MIKLFTFTGARKVVFGSGSFDALGDHLRDMKAVHPLVVLDKNLAASGFGKKVAAVLKGTGIQYTPFDRVEAEPPLELADQAAKTAIKAKCDAVIGIGGGSAMDVAKAVAALAANKGKAVDYLGLNKVPGPGLPTIMVPTTAIPSRIFAVRGVRLSLITSLYT